MICRGGNGTNGCYLVVNSLDVAFAHYFVTTRLPLPSHPTVVVVVLATPVKQVSKMAGNSVSFSPLNSWLIDIVG